MINEAVKYLISSEVMFDCLINLLIKLLLIKMMDIGSSQVVDYLIDTTLDTSNN